jgi:hypothetical protein
MKILRYSSKPRQAYLMHELCEKLLPLLDKFSLITLMHISIIGTNIQYLHPKLIQEIVRKFNDNIETVRLKDLDRISLVIALYDLKTEDEIEIKFMQNVIKELKNRVNEIALHPQCFLSILHYLSIKNVYDTELLSSALKESFINFAYGNE